MSGVITTQIRMNVCQICNRRTISVTLTCGHGYCEDCYTTMLSLSSTCLQCSAIIEKSDQVMRKWSKVPEICTTNSPFD